MPASAPILAAVRIYVNGIQHIGIPTNDLAATKEFYIGLGFELVYETLDQEVAHAVLPEGQEYDLITLQELISFFFCQGIHRLKKSTSMEVPVRQHASFARMRNWNITELE